MPRRTPLAAIIGKLHETALSLFLYRQVNRIQRSEIFDPDHYLAANPEARQSGLDPALHYVMIGSKELLDPSPSLSARMLLTQVPTFRVGIDNPVFFLEDHYTALDKPLPDLRAEQPLSVRSLLDNLHAGATAQDVIGSQSVDIIVPIHNNADKLKLLLQSLNSHTPDRHTIILIDDGSTQQDIPLLLADFTKDRNNVEIVTHRENLGFATSVNQGLRHSTNHKILLNSDTIVPDGWVDRLVAPILRDPGVASVTPWSNASTYTGFPENRIELPLSGPSEVTLKNETLSLFPALDRELTCGVGFCMAINSNVLETIGYFDESTFKHGYFEDTEWCYRAKKAGYRNVLANRLFVGHDHTSSSFGNTRKMSALAISEAGMRTKFPGYFDEMNGFYLADPHQDLRRQCELVAACSNVENMIAIIEDGLTNGRSETIRQMARQAATGTDGILRIIHNSGSFRVAVEGRHLAMELVTSDPTDIFELMERLGVKMVVTDSATANVGIGPFCGQLREHPTSVNWKFFTPDALASSLLSGTPQTQNRPLRVGVIGPAPDQNGWDKVVDLLDHIPEAKNPLHFVIFGDIPNHQITSNKVSATGIYRLENIPALIRHHDIDVIYFPSVHTHIFACTYRHLMAMSLPIVTHGSARTEGLARTCKGWVIAPEKPVDQILASLEISARSYQENVALGLSSCL